MGAQKFDFSSRMEPKEERSLPNGQFTQAAIALAHCGWGHEQRSFIKVSSAASEHAWLQYFSPSETGQVHCG
jgi:hypothetical protein